MVSTALLVMIYLSFISLGLPDSMLGSAWPAMNVSLNAPLWGAGLVQMLISLHDYFQSEQRKTDPQIWNGEADGDFRRDDGACAAGLFAGEKLCVFAADGCAARTGRGRGGRGAE